MSGSARSECMITRSEPRSGKRGSRTLLNGKNLVRSRRKGQKPFTRDQRSTSPVQSKHLLCVVDTSAHLELPSALLSAYLQRPRQTGWLLRLHLECSAVDSVLRSSTVRSVMRT